MKHGNKIIIPKLKYCIMYYKPSKDGNLHSHIYTSADVAKLDMNDHIRTGYTIFDFHTVTVHEDTEFTID